MTMNESQIAELFLPLWNDIDTDSHYPVVKPLLAHYTSISTLEVILRTKKIWFSNPLFMNDWDELRFGLLQGARAFREHTGISRAFSEQADYQKLRDDFDHYFDEFDKNALDVYVFCLSRHIEANTDGLLSMWRGYGGNGSGVAIIFDTQSFSDYEDNSLILAPVTYASTEERHAWINNTLNKFAEVLAAHQIPQDKLYLAAYQLLERLKMFALFTKHKGFIEENEWRFVYLKERDTAGQHLQDLTYTVTSQGVQPKLEVDIGALRRPSGDNVPVDSLIKNIVLGPTSSSILAINSVQRMIDKLGYSALSKRVIGSTIPYRTS